MVTRLLFAVPVVGICVAMLMTVVASNPRWTVDGFSYARMALEDAGVAPAEALRIARNFYLTTPAGHKPKYAPYFNVDAKHAPQAAGPVFRPRVLYPWLSSLLYPKRGMHALLDVSAIAYLVGTLAMYWLLLALARPWLAALGAIAFAVSPLLITLAESALTDMTAVALWIITLASLFYFLARRRLFFAVSFAAAIVALALTRPMVYLPLGATAGALVWARIRRDAQDTRNGLALGAMAVAVTIGSFVWGAYQHAAGLSFELELSHSLAVRSGSATPNKSLQAWYGQALFRNLVSETKRSVRMVLPILALLAMALDFRRKEMAILLGAVIAGVLPLFVDLSPFDLPRTLEAPLYPVILATLAIGVERLIRSRS